jgi:hypothetical protein
MSVADIADPRSFPERADRRFAALLERAATSLASTAVAESQAQDASLEHELAEAMRAGDGTWLAELLAAAPSAPIARQLWRRLLAAWNEVAAGPAGELGVTLLAFPIVVIAGEASGASDGEIGCALPEVERLHDILVEHGALGGNLNFALAPALAAAGALEVARLPRLLAWTRWPAAEREDALRDVEPAPIAVAAGQQTAHLRFLLVAAIAAPGALLRADPSIAAWGLPLARELMRQLAPPGISLLALPRSAQAPLQALQDGSAAQREVGAQLFASNALRRLRASVGEPAAVISAHRCPSAAGGGELRLSLSSAFDPRQAEGFRCPLFPYERAGDVVAMLLDLLHDCRVGDVTVLPSVYPDRDPATGLTLLLKAESLREAGGALQ